MSFQNCRIFQIAADPEKYHTVVIPRGDPTYVISSSSLRAFSDCPSEWVTGIEEPDTKSTIFGSLYDCRLLTPDQFASRYTVRPESYPAGKTHKLVKDGEIAQGDPVPWSAQATFCRKWVKENANGKIVVSPELLANCDEALARMKKDVILNSFIEASDKQVWIEGQWHDTPTGMVVPARCLLDLVPLSDSEYASCAGDVKTARSVAIDKWESDAYRTGYHIQGAWNIDMLNAATGEERDKFCYLLQRNTHPWATGRRRLGPHLLERGRNKIRTLMAQYCSCVKSGKWPDYDDNDVASQGWTTWEEAPWMDGKELFAIKMQFEGSEEVETANDPPWMHDPPEGQTATAETAGETET